LKRKEMRMKRIFVATSAWVLLVGSAPAKAVPDALTALVEGNKRFTTGQVTHPNQSAARRHGVAAAQKPFAIIVGCADSRVPPELVFDQGLGEVFVVRAAGEVVDDVGLGSIEFAVAKLGARLVVVLGHERCGAVEAALKGGAVPGHIGVVVDAIKPAISSASSEPGDTLDNAIRDNVRAVVARLRSSEPVLAPMVRDGSLRVVGAVYDLDTGVAQIVDPVGQPCPCSTF
jgi:carbonic anhydrase